MLDRIGTVWEHEETGLTFVWPGSHTVKIYETGVEMDVLEFGYGEDEPLTEEQAVEAIQDYIQARIEEEGD